ncbi:hypothetical protein N566_17315 [Streptomycetaceae bacterium MP113-05]|nr:hypothetical protein N566_17315 [Streptomycetaceae bacterium MP113-05]
MPATATPPESPGPAPVDELPVDVATIRATVDRALEQGTLPAREDLVELEGLLRGHIQLLLPVAEAAVEQLAPGTVEYVGQRQVLNIAAYRTGRPLAHNRATAHTHVRLLAHDARALLAYAPGASR